MSFKKHNISSSVPPTPEALYPTLPHTAEAPRELWSRQADVLRVYAEKHKASTDVAIELPTGAGKTLVGCLVAEWRRQSKQERVAYLTPTRQLAQQAAKQARSYGVPAVDLTGKHKQWDPSDELKFTQGRAVAFATYKALFNSNPHLRPQSVVLDDAHAAEGAVASTWSMSIYRNEATYNDVLRVLSDHGAFSPAVTRRLKQRTAGRVYLAGIVEAAAAAAELERVLEDAQKQRRLTDGARFGYVKLSEGLSACLIFASSDEIHIRPLIAPTLSHPQFHEAVQRVYLSATLGDGGELERAFGRKRIARIEAPANWENQGTGRRFFCFPELAHGLGEDTVPEFVRDEITVFGKAVVLAPHKRSRDKLMDAATPSGISVWRADASDDAAEEFLAADRGILALANRYDGIDLPDNACRLIVMVGRPTGAHLQERFLYESLGAQVVLNERIRTRITQGAGRATRNSADYAAVIMLGRDLREFCMPQEHLDAMHPELRAELSFGLEYSDRPETEVRENLDHFRLQDDEWQVANQEIRALRDEKPRTALPGTAQLSTAVPHEVSAIDAAWQGDWPRAVEQARKATDALAGGNEIRHYQALWHYLLASWAILAAERDGREHWIRLADQHFADARNTARGTQWLRELTTDATSLLAAHQQETEEHVDPLHEWVIDHIANSPARTSNKTFREQEKIVRDGLWQTEHKPFEAALDALGRLLGAETLPPSGQEGRPDSVWMFDDYWWVAIEAKSEALPEKEVPLEDVRQACGHLSYAAAQTKREIPDGSLTLMVTPQISVATAGIWVADKPLYLVHLEQIQQVASNALAAWDTVRAQTRELQAEDACPLIAELLSRQQSLPDQWLPGLNTRLIGAP